MAEGRIILIVEDEPLITMILKDFLESMGHAVGGTCDTVSQALAEANKGAFDLAILDINLKGESIWPVAAALRDNGTPFILASGGHVESPPPEFKNAPIIEKPFTIDKVTPIIEAALTQSGS